MELVEGETIEEWVRHKGPIDCPTALDIALQITRALIATGSRQFVHRDVKPSNVMLCSEADGAIVAKLIDFGLVRDITDQSASGSPVRTGFIGTPHFASPEQFAGETTDARSDIFSLGVTLWFMLTGKLPFDGTRDEIRQKQLSGALPLDQLKGIPRTVVDLIKRMLEADPAKRPQSPAELKEQLNKCIAAIDAAKQKQRRRFAVQRVGGCSDYHCRAGSFLHSPTEVRLQRSERNRAGKKHCRIAVCESDRRSRWRLFCRWHPCANRRAPGEDRKFKGRLWQQYAQRYESAPENPAQVAADLGVADILEGSVEKKRREVSDRGPIDRRKKQCRALDAILRAHFPGNHPGGKRGRSDRQPARWA